jgi:hypothetical protein
MNTKEGCTATSTGQKWRRRIRSGLSMKRHRQIDKTNMHMKESK